MMKQSKKVLKLLTKVVKGHALGSQGWPPNCLGILYQPQRPMKQKKSEE